MDRQVVGTFAGTAIDVAPWDGVRAPVDLSCACMFAQEAPGKAITGGLLHLDQALGGALTKLRSEGVFRGSTLESVLLSKPPASIAAKAVLVIGLGDPEDWTPEAMTQAVALAVRVALSRGDHDAAFAPSLIDSGIDAARVGNGARNMVAGLRQALGAQQRLEALRLAGPAALSRWTFDSGAEHLPVAAASFRAALQSGT